MKKFMPVFLFSLLCFVGLSFYSCGISNSEAERIILKHFPLKDKNGHYQLINIDIRTRKDFAMNLRYYNGLQLLETKSGRAIYTGSLFGGEPGTVNNYRFTEGQSTVIIYAKGNNWRFYGDGVRYAVFKKVPLLKEYFDTIETWKDKRKNSERSYAKYTTKIMVNKPYYDLFKTTDAKVYHSLSTEFTRMVLHKKHVTMQDYINFKKRSTKPSTRTFTKDSRGNWR